jgi:hypothetical protein
MYVYDDSITLTKNVARLLQSIEISGNELVVLEENGVAPPKLVVKRLKVVEVQWESVLKERGDVARSLEVSLKQFAKSRWSADELVKGRLQRLYTILASLPGDPTTAPRRRRGHLQGDPTTPPKRKKPKEAADS